MTLAVCLTVLVIFALGAAWGTSLERERWERFPFAHDHPPSAKVRRLWVRERLDINPALRRKP